mmetsp:Transcript_7959/g.29811  ORF Transcript_7959/g.29811 Transcript_7959/m.29811 type:complete len:268 (-) Transcript_7959:2024-2827(-)
MLPVRPYPAMMTCPERSFASPSLGCNDATEVSSLKYFLKFDPKLANSGVMAIVSTTARLIWFTMAMGNKPAAAARPYVTNANSPPGAMYTAALSEASMGTPNRGPQMAMTPILIARNPTAMAMIDGKLANKVAGSICMPTVMKNSPSSNPRNGAMSDSTCRWNSVSARSKPARNAPRAMESPRDCVSRDVPKDVNSVVAINTSAFFSFAMRLYTGLKIPRPATMMAPMATTVLKIALISDPAMAVTLPESGPARSGTNMNTSTTVRS